MLGELLARAEGYPKPQEAFTAGILHNLGRMALDQVRSAHFRHARTLAAQRGISLHEAEREVFGFTDTEVGGALALRWQFPPDLALAIAHHADPPGRLGEGQDLASLIARARAFARSHGITDGVDPLPPPAATASPYQAVMAAMSPLDLPTGEVEPAAASSGVPEPLELMVQEQGGVNALLERAAAFVEQTAAGP